MTNPKLTKALLTVVLFVTVTQTVHAVNFNANNNDLLLVFRKTSSKDMIYDVGSVSNYLSVAPGVTIPVTGYTTNQVYTNFNNSFSGVIFTLAAVTADSDPLARLWMTDADLVNVPNDVTVNEYANASSILANISHEASINTGNSPTAPYVVSASTDTSYSYIVSPGNSSAISTWNGNIDFVVETTSGGSLKFYELLVKNTTPPGRWIGTFNMAANGVITFTGASTAAPLVPAHITTIASSGNTLTVYFTTTNSSNYRLVYTTGLTNGMGTNGWTQLPGSVAGDGTVKSLTDTSTGGRFYKVQTY